MKKLSIIVLSFILALVQIQSGYVIDIEASENNVIISKDISVTGFQVSTSIIVDGEEEVGIRTVYQAEELVEGQQITEIGLLYGLESGGITEEDLTLDSESEYVIHQNATEMGKCDVQMGESTTANYYVMTMPVSGGYNENYFVRPYARLVDGSEIYGEVSKYNVYDIAKKIYTDRKMPTYPSHQVLYEKILKRFGEDEIDYDWNNTLVNKVNEEALLKIEGYQMTANLREVEGTMGLRVVYSAEQLITENASEIGLIYGLVYDLGNGIISEAEMVIDVNNAAVVQYAATSEGIINAQMGDSESAVYYARTMNVTNFNATGLGISILVRAYAKMNDGTVVYSGISKYSTYDIADRLYQNNLMSTFKGHSCLYDKILHKVNPDYKEVDYDWSNTMTSSGDDITTSKHDYKYYSSIEAAVTDANDMTTENSLQGYKNAVAGLYIDSANDRAEIILYRDAVDTESIIAEKHLEIDLNQKSITFQEGEGIIYKDDLLLENGSLEFDGVGIAINGLYSDELENCSLEINNVEIQHSADGEDDAPRTIVTSYANISESEIISNGTLSVAGLYLSKSTKQSNIVDCTFRTSSTENNSYNIYACNAGDIRIEGGNYQSETSAKGWSICFYTESEGTNMSISNVNASATGNQYNNVSVYNSTGCQMTIDGGYHYVTTVPTNQSDKDSYGTALLNNGSMTVSGEIQAIGGNAAISCMPGSETIVNGGTFKSPNHGGIYVSSGSNGKCVINGGSFICNRDDYTEEELGTISSFGAAYFGCSQDSEAWSVDVKNAVFVNQFGQGIVQKSNENYIPPTINLYNCSVYGSSYDLVVQDNTSVDTYKAYINLYEGTVLETGKVNDLYHINGGESHIIDYR